MKLRVSKLSWREDALRGVDELNLVLACATRDEVVDYLRKRHSQHRELTPREVLGPMRAHHSDEE